MLHVRQQRFSPCDTRPRVSSPHIIVRCVATLRRLRSCFIATGICSSCVSDCCSNSIRVVKTTKQTAPVPVSPLVAIPRRYTRAVSATGATPFQSARAYNDSIGGSTSLGNIKLCAPPVLPLQATGKRMTPSTMASRPLWPTHRSLRTDR